jgi:hypothetical protein
LWQLEMPLETFKLPKCHWKLDIRWCSCTLLLTLVGKKIEFQLWKFGCGDLKKLHWVSNSRYLRYVRILLANDLSGSKHENLVVKIWRNSFG